MAAIIPDNIFKCVFLNENAWISIKISLKFVPKDPMNNIPALVIDGLVQERHNSSASAMELRLSCITHRYAPQGFIELTGIEDNWIQLSFMDLGHSLNVLAILFCLFIILAEHDVVLFNPCIKNVLDTYTQRQ